MSDNPPPVITHPVTPEARRQAAILDVMTENARLRTARAGGTRKALVIIVCVLFFPIALPIYLIWWVMNRNS